MHKITVQVDRIGENDLRVAFFLEGADGFDLPLAVQDDIRLTRARFFRGGRRVLNQTSIELLRSMMEDIIQRHTDLGNLDFVPGIGFIHGEDARSLLA